MSRQLFCVLFLQFQGDFVLNPVCDIGHLVGNERNIDPRHYSVCVLCASVVISFAVDFIGFGFASGLVNANAKPRGWEATMSAAMISGVILSRNHGDR